MIEQPYDFDRHRTRAFQDYAAVRDRYVRYAATIESILRMAVKDVHTHHISARAKELDRFAAKASKPNAEDPTRPKYAQPLLEIEDMAAARIITYVLRALPQVEAAVQREFKVVERSDKNEQLLQRAQVGYRSIHLIVEMKPERASLLEYREFDGLRAEIQIRTILQHAWAEIEHDMRYKPLAEPNRVLSQRFTALAGLIEVGDREFEQIYEIDEKRRRDLVDLAQISELPVSVEGTSNIEGKFKDDGTVAIAVPPSDPGHVGTDEVQPRELISTGNYSEAIARYNALIQREPRQFSNFLGRAKARFLSGDAQGALTDIAAAEALSPQNQLVARVKSLIEGQGEEQQSSRTEHSLALRQGHTALRDGDYETALLKYSEAEDQGFNPVFSVFNRAMAHFLGQNVTECLRTLDGIDPYPRSALRLNVVILRALCFLLSGGDPSVATARVSTTLEESKDYTRFQYNARSPLQDLELGIQKRFDLVERTKVSPIFDLLRRFDSDAHVVTSGSGIRQRSVWASLLDLANAAEGIGDSGQAYKLFEEFLSLSVGEQNSEGILVAAGSLGRLAKKQGDSDKAAVFFEQAIQAARSLARKKELSWNLGNLGTVLRERGAYAEAEACYSEALEVAEQISDVRSAAITLDNLGVVYGRLGDFERAAGCFRRAIAVDPGAPTSVLVAAHHINLGIVLWRAGKPDDARQEWQLAYSSVSPGHQKPWRFESPSSLEEHMGQSDASVLPFV